jgi:hypothetical protein
LNDAETIISQPGSGTTINNTKVYRNGIQIQPTTISTTNKEDDRINCSPYKDITKLSGITYSIVVSGGTSVSGNTISSIDIYNKDNNEKMYNNKDYMMFLEKFKGRFPIETAVDKRLALDRFLLNKFNDKFSKKMLIVTQVKSSN